MQFNDGYSHPNTSKYWLFNNARWLYLGTAFMLPFVGGCFLFPSGCIQVSSGPPGGDDATYETTGLAGALNAWREDVGLNAIPASDALNQVASTHTTDLITHHPDAGACNLHSWSDEGEWSACCYTDSGSEAQCMWVKPSELTDYAGYGYEIAAWRSGGITVEEAILQWQSSEGHADVALNQGAWASHPWKAMGAALQGEYAVIWFGEVE